VQKLNLPIAQVEPCGYCADREKLSLVHRRRMLRPEKSPIHVPRTMLDDEVDVRYLPDAVANYRDFAEGLMVNTPCFTLDESESRYGRFVP
jgi:hypothetical protein